MSQNTDYRDMSVPYSEEELASVVEIFKSLPTFENDSIASTDMAVLIERMRYKRTPEQNAAYKKYWDLLFGGRIPLNIWLLIFKAIHERKKWYLVAATHLDTNKNGFIDPEDFKYMLDLTLAHDPTVAGLTYEQFVQEADLNEDGKVSIEESAEWIEKRASAAANP